MKNIIIIIVLVSVFFSSSAQTLTTKINADLRSATSAVAISPDGKLLISGGAFGLKIYEFNNGDPKLIEKIDTYSFVFDIVFSPDGNFFGYC